MEKTTRKIREYGLKDFIKVLRGNWLTLLLCVLLTAAVLGGSLGCVSAFIRHNEYSATIAKVDTATFDVPVVRASLRDHIEVILKEKYPHNGLSDKDFNDLSNAVNARLSLSENPEGTFAFTLSSFDAKQVHMSQDDFKDILNRIIDWYKESYTDKIVTSYLIKASAIGESTKKLTYYLQIRTLENTIDSLIGEVRIVAGMEQMPGIDISDTTISSSTTVDRSEFAAYYCEENGKRVNDILTDLENLDAAVAAARAFVCNNGVENPDASASMQDYIDGELLKYPVETQDAVLTQLKGLFGDDSPYNQADADGKTELETGAQTRIDAIVSSLQTILDDYNLLARSYAASTIPNYVIISTLTTDEDLGAIAPFAVVLITAACAIVAFLIGFFVSFNRMQKTGEIGIELVEESGEEA